MIESYLSAVCVAECDEMGHMNIQHYAAKAEAAAQVLTALGRNDGAPGDDEPYAGPQQMHLRFHKEMLAGDRVRVNSARADEAGTSKLVHTIQNVGTGLICATAISAYEATQAPKAPAGAVPDDARPRSITQSTPAAATREQATETGMVRTHLSLIEEADCLADAMTVPAFLNRMSRCQAHLWSLVGLGRREQAARGLGTASLELRVTRFAPARPDRALEILTGFTPPTGKALHYQHAGFDAVTGVCCFLAEGVGVMMDLSTRRAVVPPIPQSDFA